jgi:hypothetical protein
MTADLNEDGLQDLVTVSEQEVSVFACLSQGDGTIRVLTTPVLASNSHSAAVGDVNGDGHQDVLVGVWSPDFDVRVLAGDGSGRFTDSGSTIRALFDPWALTLSDLDRDGDLDLIACSRNADSLAVLRGHGDGSFDPPARYPPHATGLIHPVVCDLNADGWPDIVAADATGRGISVLLGEGDAAFRVLPRVDPPGVRFIREFEVADWNGDGRPDLAVSAETPELYDYVVSTLFGTGTGGFTPGPIHRDSWLLPKGLAAGDVDQDGRMDLVVSGWDRDQTLLLTGSGDGSFVLADSVGVNYRGWDNALLDLDRDGLLDVATLLGSGGLATHLQVGLPVEAEVTVSPHTLRDRGFGIAVSVKVTPPPTVATQSLFVPTVRLGGVAPLVRSSGIGSEKWLMPIGGAYHLKFPREGFAALGPGEHRLDLGGCLGNGRGIRGAASLRILSAPAAGRASSAHARLRSIPGRIPVEVAWNEGSEPEAGGIVFDVRGRFVTRVVQTPGFPRTLSWDGRSSNGTPVPAGVYFIRVGAHPDPDVIKALVIR